MAEEDESGRITRRHAAVLTHDDLSRIERSIDSLRKDIRTDFQSLLEAVKELNDRHAALDVWKATIDLRLAGGVEKMNALQKQIEGCVEKKIVLAYLAGSAVGGSAITALVMKALSAGTGGH
jgi:hypothetical protein